MCLPAGLSAAQVWVYLCEELREVVVAFRGTEQVCVCVGGATSVCCALLCTTELNVFETGIALGL